MYTKKEIEKHKGKSIQIGFEKEVIFGILKDISDENIYMKTDKVDSAEIPIEDITSIVLHYV